MSGHEQTFHVGDAGSNPAGDANTYEISPEPVTPISPQFEWAPRFWKKVRAVGVGECWPWVAGKGRRGCGLFHLGGRTISAPRVAWWLANGREPTAGMMVLHSCDNPTCCNPAHLREGTAKDNSDDMFARGRNAPQKRARNGNAKLTEADVAEIKSLVARGVRPSTVAKDFKVNESHVYDILKGERWAS